jgi:hypothetical protein
MDLQLIIKLKSSYEEWHQTFVNHVDVRSKICNENKTLVAKANESTALVTIFDGAIMSDPDFQKMNEPLVEEISPYSITPLKP